MGGLGRETKQESSVPVQSRVSLVTLAELNMYWESSGHEIRSMSQLLAWSIDLLCEVLRANEKLPVSIEKVAEAHRYLKDKGIYQKSLEKRSFKKIGTAIRFDSMREEGFDPKQYVPLQHKMVHKEGSVEVFDSSRVSTGKYMDDLIEAERRAKEIEGEEFEEKKTEALESIKKAGYVKDEGSAEEEEVRVNEGGNMSEEDLSKLIAQQEKRDRKRIAEERNA